MKILPFLIIYSIYLRRFNKKQNNFGKQPMSPLVFYLVMVGAIMCVVIALLAVMLIINWISSCF
ncbi:MAG: hypothetical protein IJF76_01855 [Clostridia bacterium]|nr:hypothetical protein [Clostridia bacterium]